MRAWLATLLLFAVGKFAHGAPPCEGQAKMVTDFGEHYIWPHNLVPRDVKPLEAEGDVRYLQVFVRRKLDTGDLWRLTVRDRAGRPLQNISSRQVAPGGTIWTDRLHTRSLLLQADEPGASGTIAETLEYVAIMASARHPYYSKQGDVPNWEDVYGESSVPSRIRRLSKSVGMFIGTEGNSIDGVSVWTCSGFVLANQPSILFVTNDHCGGNWSDAAGRSTTPFARTRSSIFLGMATE